MSVVEIAYNPNDFYYSTSGVYNGISIKCPDYLDPDKNYECSNITSANVNTCYELEVCKNKQYADLVNNLENNNSGTNERHTNMQNIYQNEIIKTINISASILLITYLTVYFFKT